MRIVKNIIHSPGEGGEAAGQDDKVLPKQRKSGVRATSSPRVRAPSQDGTPV